MEKEKNMPTEQQKQTASKKPDDGNNSKPEKKKMSKKAKKRIIIIAVILAIAAAAFFAYKFFSNKKPDMSAGFNQMETVERGDVEVTISGSGTIEPNERYEIIPLVNGEIMSCPYEVGDYVEEGAVIYSFDKSDAELGVQKQQNQISTQKNSLQSQTNQISTKQNALDSQNLTYNQTVSDGSKLTVTAPSAGRITALSVHMNDKLNTGTPVATLIDDAVMKVNLPFTETQVHSISVGDLAIVSSSELMSTFSGSVTHIDTNPTAQENGVASYNVTIQFNNPGGIAKGALLGGSVGNIISGGKGAAEYNYEKTITTETGGTVTGLYVQNGDYVSSGTTILNLSSDEYTNSLKKSENSVKDAQTSLKDAQISKENAQINLDNAKIALQEQINNLEDYDIKAPISGTVITKNSKKGDTIDKTNASVTMMVIADVSKLKFTLPIDELDVEKIQVGQEVKVTSDAVEGKTFIGYITEMSMEGESTNGVTTYNATVTIDDPGELKPSMNVDAVVVVQSAKDVIRVESGNIKTAKGKSFVFLRDESIPLEDNKNNEKKSGMSMMSMGGNKNANDKKDENSNKKAEQNSENASEPTAPAGYKTVEIQVGIKGDEYTEVISGLNEGDKIYIVPSAGSANSFMAMMSGMGATHSGMAGGGAPGGGAPGGGTASGGAKGGNAGGNR